MSFGGKEGKRRKQKTRRRVTYTRPIIDEGGIVDVQGWLYWQWIGGTRYSMVSRCEALQIKEQARIGTISTTFLPDFSLTYTVFFVG